MNSSNTSFTLSKKKHAKNYFDRSVTKLQASTAIKQKTSFINDPIKLWFQGFA